MLNADEAYFSRSQAFIRTLLSGVHGNGSSAGRGGGAKGTSKMCQETAW